MQAFLALHTYKIYTIAHTFRKKKVYLCKVTTRAKIILVAAITNVVWLGDRRKMMTYIPNLLVGHNLLIGYLYLKTCLNNSTRYRLI